MQLINPTLQQIVARIHWKDGLNCHLMIGFDLDIYIAHASGVVFQNVSIINDSIFDSSQSDL